MKAATYSSIDEFNHLDTSLQYKLCLFLKKLKQNIEYDNMYAS